MQSMQNKQSMKPTPSKTKPIKTNQTHQTKYTKSNLQNQTNMDLFLLISRISDNWICNVRSVLYVCRRFEEKLRDFLKGWFGLRFKV